MKKIHFGYSNDDNPRGSHEGIGASLNKDIVDADFIDFVQFDDKVYLISRVFEEKRMLLDRCCKSFSDMQRELQELYAKLDEYENTNRTGRYF